MRVDALGQSDSRHCLYITYDGLLDPLGRTQILPYILGLSEFGYRFTILSYEKTDRDPLLLNELAIKLHSKKIAWTYLPFVHGRFQGLLRLIKGACAVRRIAKKDPFVLVHVRTILPALIFWLSLIKRPFIYDIRAFLGQWVDGGRLGANSLSCLFLSCLENWLIRNAAGLVVLDQSGFDYLCERYKELPPVKVIPTSTELSRTSGDQCVVKAKPRTQVRFVCLGGARFPYLPMEAFEFVQALLALGYPCSIDFINNSDHAFIEQACHRIGFPRDCFHLFSLSAEEVHSALQEYDCGLVFIADGPWIRMSSPTKIGEYLAAGLHLVGLQGIAALDRLAIQSSCVDVLPRSEHGCSLSSQQAFDLVSRIKSPTRSSQAQNLAAKHYDRVAAVAEYVDLYQKILPID